MKIRRLLNRLKMLCTVFIVLLILGLIGSLAYLHSIGLPESLKTVLLEKLKEEDIHLSFDSLKYKLNKGLVAENVQLYKTEKQETPLYSTQFLSLNIDKTKLLRGVFELDSATVEAGQVSVPVVSKFLDSPIIDINDITGTFSLSKSKQLESEDGLSFHYEGIKLTIKGRAWKTKKEKIREVTEEEKKAIVANYRQFRNLIRTFQWDPQHPPNLTLYVDGDISDVKKLQLDFELQAPKLQYKQAHIKKLCIKGSLNRQLVRLTELSFSDQKGDYSAQGDLSLALNKGTFSCESSVDFKNLINGVTETNFAPKMKFLGDSNIQATGTIDLPRHSKDGTFQPFKLELLGEAELRNVSYLDANLDFISSEFSWKSNSLFLDKLQAYSGENEFNGRLLMGPEEIKFSSTSSLPPQLFIPFLKGLKIDRILEQVNIDESSIANISAEGVINRKDLSISHIEGDLYIADITYRDTLLKEGGAAFKLNGEEAVYSKPFIIVDHSNWHKQQKFGIGKEGSASAEQVTMKRDPETGHMNINLTGLTGEVWPSPVIRLFHLKAYDLFSKLHIQAPIKINTSNLNFNFKRPFFHTTGDISLAYAKLTDTALHDTRFKLDLTRGKSNFLDISTSADYTNYPRGLKYGGPPRGQITVDKVSLIKNPEVKQKQQILLSGVKGEVWPAPLTAMFAKKVAPAIEAINFTSLITSKNSNLSIFQTGDTATTLLDLKLDSISYNEVKATDARGSVSISEGETTFKEVTLTMDYTGSNDFKKHGGTKSSELSIGEVKLGNSYASFSKLQGVLWPGYLASMFNREVATTLEDIDLTTPLKCLDADMKILYGEKQLTTGNLKLGPFSYANKPINSASCSLQVEPGRVSFKTLEAQLNNTAYKVKKEFSGPSSSKLTADRITFLTDKQLVEINKLQGNFWPGVVVGLFSSDVADSIDEFRFATPPYSSSSGVLDIRDNSKNTNLNSSFSAGKFRYNFLDSDIPGTLLKANIQTTSNQVTATNIKADIFKTTGYTDAVTNKYVHPLSGNFTLFYNKQVPSYTGDLAINQLNVSSLAEVYDFEDLKTGKFSTLFQFKGDTSGVGNLSTTKDNTFILEDSNIAKIPLLGPFSKITSVLGNNSSNERLGYSKISKAFALYSVIKGVLVVKDLEAKSASLNLKGTGKYNLDSERVDMTFELSGFKKGISFLELVRPFIKKFPIIKGIMKYKVYGQLDDLKILPDI